MFPATGVSLGPHRLPNASRLAQVVFCAGFHSLATDIDIFSRLLLDPVHDSGVFFHDIFSFAFFLGVRNFVFLHVVRAWYWQ